VNEDRPTVGFVGLGAMGWLMAKDTRIAASIAAAAGIDAPVIALASERWAAAAQELGPAVDQSRAHQAWTDAKFSRRLWQYRPRGRTGRAGGAG
jgi:3-hydroxyisobutyrate dehydrogenase-like beta-hydroxyacid dehydrogenase